MKEIKEILELNSSILKREKEEINRPRRRF